MEWGQSALAVALLARLKLPCGTRERGGFVVWQMDACAWCGAGWVGSGACAHTLGMRGGIWRVNIEAALSENNPVLKLARKHRQLPSKLHPNPSSSFVWHFYCGAILRNVNLLLMTFFILNLGEKPDNKWKTGALVPMATV